MTEAFGWTPGEIAAHTPAQLAIYLKRAGDAHVEREDDWSQFGLYREGDKLKGPDEALERYSEYRQQKVKANGNERG